MNKLILLGFTIVVVASCSKSDDQQPIVVNGKLAGTLSLVDEFGVALTGHIGMTVQVQTGLSGISDNSGKYTISGLATGYYTLTFKKDSFAEYKRFGIYVDEGAQVTSLNGVNKISRISTTYISNLSASLNPTDSSYSIFCTVNPAPDSLHLRAFRIFFKNGTAPTPGDYDYTTPNNWVAATSSGAVTGIQRSEFYSNGFSVGDTVHVAAYGESYESNTYTDPVTYKKHFPTLNLSGPVSTATFVLE